MKNPPLDPWLKRYNNILKESDSFYRNAARRLGVPECALWILYTLRAEEPPVTQKRLCQQLLQPKQTINSALKSLEAEGYLTLSAGEDRRTRVITLTEKGAVLAGQTADRIIQAEQGAFQAMEPEEAEEFLRLYKKYVERLEEAGLQAESQD